VSIPNAMPVPKGTAPATESVAFQSSPRQQHRHNHKHGSVADSPSTKSNGGARNVTLLFDCVWCVPGSEGGALGPAAIGIAHKKSTSTNNEEVRRFGLKFFVSDNTLQVNEVNARNSGRGRESLFHLRRQQLTNPHKRAPNGDPAPYVAADMMVGNSIQG
jgi:hypothetical protein